MKLLGSRRSPALPGRVLTVRAHRNLATLLTRIEPGDLVLVDQRDLNAETARALVDRKPFGVLNAAEFISGRYANLGPRVLAENGVVLLEGLREQVLGLHDGAVLRLHENTLFDGPVVVLDVVEVSPERVRAAMESARSGLAVQLDSFAHAASEFVRREEPLLLHGTGAPALRTKLAGRTVVVVGPGARPEDLKRLRRFLRSSRPVLIGVDSGIDLLADSGRRADVAVLSGAAAVSDKALRRSREVVLAEPGQAVGRQVEKLNLPAAVIATGAAPADIGLLLAHHGGAKVVVPVGSPSTIEEFIDRDRADQASNVLVRLRLGSRVVEGDAVPSVLPRRRRALKAATALVLVGALVGFGFTSTAHGWWDDARDKLPDGFGGTAALDRKQAELADRDAQIARLQADLSAGAGYEKATAADVVRGTLKGRTVAVVALPGAEPATVAALRALVRSAGAEVTADVTVEPAATADAQQGVVDALTSQMLTQNPDVAVPSGATGEQRLGALLGRAVSVPPAKKTEGASFDASAVSLVSGLRTAKLVTAKVSSRAGLTLLVAGPAGDEAADTVLASLVRSYGSAVASVVTGPDGAAVLARLRAKPTSVLSTVDGAGATTGQVAAVLAIAARANGTIGSYGSTGTDGIVPPDGDIR